MDPQFPTTEQLESLLNKDVIFLIQSNDKNIELEGKIKKFNYTSSSEPEIAGFQIELNMKSQVIARECGLNFEYSIRIDTFSDVKLKHHAE